jgi:hypothetical protein
MSANPDHAHQDEDHEIWPSFGGFLQLLPTRLLDLADLLGDELLSRQVAAHLGERIGRDRLALRRAQVFQALRRLLELWIEVADPEPGQGRLDAVDDGGVLANEGFALTVRALGVLLREGGDGGHLAVVALTAQPAEKGALELLGIEPVGLCTPVFARYRYACRMNDMGLDTARREPAGQPEAIPAGLEGDDNAGDLVPRLLRFRTPALEQL